MNARKSSTHFLQKKQLFVLALFLILFTKNTFSQAPSENWITPRGMFDTLHDRIGNKYLLANLNISSGKPIGGSSSVTAVPSLTCQAGYFKLYFAQGTYFANSLGARTVLCQVFSDISNLIVSNCGPGTINILCGDISGGGSALATAVNFMSFPYGPNNPNQGIVDNEVYKYLVSGQNPYAALPLLIPTQSSFYHGMIQMKPSGVNWNFNMNTTAISSGDYDAYTVFLHEVVHALGFYSMIQPGGNSPFGAANKYYSRFDTYLCDAAGSPLLTSGTSGCPLNNLSFAANPTVIATATTGCVTDVSTCSTAVQYSSSILNVKMYTPNCYEAGSSLSHFEDMCPIPSGSSLGCATNMNPILNNNYYYVMSNTTGSGSCYVKRFPREEEKRVLCDLGYSVNATYGGVAVAGSSYTYSSGCAGPNVWGVNDGFVNGQYTFTMQTSVSTSIAIPTNTILGNDSQNATQISCLDVIYGGATAVVSGTNLVITLNPNASGLVVVRYLPKSASGAFGSPVYVFAYFISANCPSVNGCDLISNGGFESFWNFSVGCQTPSADCWDIYKLSPDYYRYGCPSVPHALGGWLNTFDNATNPNNTALMGLAGSTDPTNVKESMMANLSTPLIPGQAYKMSLWAHTTNGHPTAGSFYPFTPIVIEVRSMPLFIPASPSIPLTQFTLMPGGNWGAYTNTFVFNPGVSHSSIHIQLDTAQTAALNITTSTLIGAYFHIDDISILPLPSPTFQIPGANKCGNITFTNLAQYASPIAGVFTGGGVTSFTTGSGTQYDFNSAQTLTPGVYPVAFNYTTVSGCAQTVWQSIVIAPQQTLTASSTGSLVCTNNAVPVNLTMSLTCPSCTNSPIYYWTPGNIYSSSLTLIPNSTITYTANAFNGTCVATQALPAITVSNCCMENVTASYNSNPVNANTTLAGNTIITTSLTVQSGNWLKLQGHIVMSPSIQITAASGASIYIEDAHLHTCANSMWQGIVIEDGAFISVINNGTSDNLIEDAITAIDIKSQSTNAPVLEASNTTFNRNYVDISITNYTNAVSPYPFDIDNCVFTCRNLPYTSNAWPQTGKGSSASTTSADLRYAFSSTTGLTPPYMQQSTFTVTSLKSPYASQRSHIAIKLDNVGVANTTALFRAVIGSTASAGDFNLFDAHGQFISAVNSNLSSQNNVFQNTQNYVVAGNSFGGAAISHSTSGTLNTELLMIGTTKDNGNRFWNCDRGVEGKNIYRMWVSNASFRSTQSSANTAFAPVGIQINTNRFEYVIQDNEFSNLEKGINIPLAAGVFSLPPNYTLPTGFYLTPGIFANRMLITQNEFNGNLGSNTYMNDAINVSAVNNTPLFPVTSTSLDPVTNALAIEANILTEVHRGINVSGLYSFPIQIASNQIVLKDNSSVQHAIKLTNNNPTIVGIGGMGYGKSVVAQNTASFSSTSFLSSPNNSVTALVHCGHNGYAFLSPSVTCNSLAQGPQGFVFDGSNKGTIWAGNDMQPMLRGFVLSNGGNIGQQGSSTTAIANIWDGTWSGANYGTYMVGSTALGSVLYVGGNPGEFPANNNGGNLPQNWYSPSTILTATVGSYSCNDMPNYKTISVPNNDDSFLSTELFYIEQQDFYYLLHVNDSIRYSAAEFESFYDTYTDQSIGVFVQAEQLLSQTDYSSARALLEELNLVDPNAIELNYLSFYTIYATYLEGEGLENDDKEALYDLAMMCPGTQGSCVYQAQALYNTIYHEILQPACVTGGDERRIYNEPAKKITQQGQIRIYPNPTEGKLTIETNSENEELRVEIRDLSNRLMYKERVKATGFFANLELNLLNGAYLIRIERTSNNAIIKKLIIAK